MSKEKTLFLKFVAVILLLVGHFSLLGAIKIPYSPYLGVLAVSIFLIVSGAGLAISYGEDRKVELEFLARRFEKIYPPFIILGLIFFAVSAVLGTFFSVSAMLVYLTGFDLSRSIDPTMWFVSFIVLNYILFCLIWQIPVPRPLRIAIFFGFSLVIFYLNLFNLPFGQSAWQFKLHAFGFPIGLSLGYLVTKKLAVHRYLKPVFLAFLIAGAWALLPRLVATNFQLLAGALLGAATFLVVLWYGPEKNQKVVSFIGGISYEIYIVEWLLMTGLLSLMGKNLVTVVVISAVIVAAAYLLSQLSLRAVRLAGALATPRN